MILKQYWYYFLTHYFGSYKMKLQYQQLHKNLF